MNNATEITFEFGDMIFKGLRLFKANKFSEKFYNELANEGSGYSKGKYIDAVHEELDEEIHIKLSLSIIANVFSIFGMIVAGFLGFAGFFLPALIVLSMSFAAQVLQKHFKTRANELLTGREMSTQLVNILFNC